MRGVARLFSNDRTVFNSELSFAFIGNQTFYGVPWLMVIAFSVIVISWVILRRTVLGVHIYAVGGAMSAARLCAANGVQLGQSYELDAIAAVILGGTSFVGGTGSIWGNVNRGAHYCRTL